MVKNTKARLDREEKGINMSIEDKRRSILSREEGIDFYPQWSLQQGVREEKWEGELHKGGKGYNRSQGGKRNNEDRRREEVQE